MKSARVAIATHARAIFNGLGKLADGRGDYISIHEDAANIVCPHAVVLESDLLCAVDVVGRVLNDPKWLDWLGQAASRDENGVLVPNERLAESRDRLDEFIRRLAELIDSLVAQLRTAERTHAANMPSPIAKATGIEHLLLHASLEAKARFTKSPWRLLLAVLTGELFSLGVIVDERHDFKPRSTADITTHNELVGIWKNLPSKDAVVLFSDATASRDDLQALLGQPVIDVTPSGHITRKKRVVQYPIDLCRVTAPGRFLAILRGVMTEFPDAQNIGVITHSSLVAALKQLSEPFAGRIIKVAYFGSGEDRASNDWHDRCDLIVVAGTPRVPGDVVQRRLIQFGDFASAGEVGCWDYVYWRGRTESGKEKTVAGRGYDHPAWERAQRSLVRAAIVQAAGRGRGLLENGCDVVIVSTEECGFPLADNWDIELFESEADLLLRLSDLSPEKSYISNKTFPAMRGIPTARLAKAVGLSESQTREHLVRLESRGLVARVGERGGWVLALRHSDDECGGITLKN